jgi:D-serine deaminase-like pyridoxal phosphate-dependent protein
VHFYDGHLAGPDCAAQASAGYDRLVAVVERLRAAGVRPGELITSGTPTFRAAASHAGLARLAGLGIRHRVSPGTVVFHDARSAGLSPDLGLRPAAVVLARVVSRPRPDVATCDAGSKSIAAEAGDPCAEVIGWPNLQALRPSEEHLPLRVLRGTAPDRGETLRLVPRHVCPTVNLAEAALVADGDRITVEPVSARAHELE